MINNIKDIADLQEVEKKSDNFILFKHSLTCPISIAANQAYEKYSEKSDHPTYRLYVQKSRELSDYVAQKYNVKHESPQVLIIENSKVTWHASHYDITEKILIENS